MAKKKEVPKEPKLADFVGRKLINMGRPEESGPLVLEFDNGYYLNITGNIHLTKEGQGVE